MILPLLLIALSTGASVTLGPATPLDPPASPGAITPRLALTPDGNDVVCSWQEPGGETVRGEPTWRVRYSILRSGEWLTPVTVYSSHVLFTNWADTPGVVPVSNEWMVSHVLVKGGGDALSYDVQLVVSASSGADWAPLWRLHQDQTGGEHGFVSMVVQPPRDPARPPGLWAFWLDGREMPGGHDHDAEQPAPDDLPGRGMMLRAALISREAITADTPIDLRVCECCNTSAALTDRGPIVVYRDRGLDEVRDIAIIRRDRGAWTRPAPVHADGWKIAGCPVNGPAVAARGPKVCVAWYTGADETERVLAAFSGDSGAAFGVPFTIDDSQPLGRTDVVMLEDGSAVVGWLDSNEASGVIRLRRVQSDGTMGEPVDVGRTGMDRDAGFPRLARAGESIIVAWTDSTVEPSRLRAAVVPITAP
jgi:hypothetical protein